MNEQETEKVMAEFPRYVCHKEVHALKIIDVKKRTPTIAELEAILALQDPMADCEPLCVLVVESPFRPIHVGLDYVKKHDPQPGGYYVVYADGYKSFSPAKAFEDGYSRVAI